MKVKTYNTSIKRVEEDRQVILPLLSDDQHYYPSGMSMSNQLPQVTNAGTKSRRRRKKGTKGGGEGGVREGTKKRKLTAEQLSFLEKNFGSEHKLDSARKDKLAGEMGLDPRQVAVWFQNRRARWRSKQLEHDYSILKTNHETLLLDKCCLEAEVCVLKEQLEEAEKEIRRLSAERPEIASDVRTQCSSISTEDTYDPSSFLGGFGGGLDEDGSLFFFTGYHDYSNNAMDLLNWNGL